MRCAALLMMTETWKGEMTSWCELIEKQHDGGPHGKKGCSEGL